MGFKILTPGMEPKYKVKCDVCGCEFICDHQDTRIGLFVGYRNVTCPCCNSDVSFNTFDARIAEREEDMKQWEEKLEYNDER